MRRFALSALGRDRPGIVAAVSRILLEHHTNIEDSQMAILRGRFSMMLIVAGPDDADEPSLRSDLQATSTAEGLDALWLEEVPPESGEEPTSTHMLSVYGVDHPGIVHAVSATLAEAGVTITDLTTKLVGEYRAQPFYAMALEIALGPEHDAAKLEKKLSEIAAAEEVDLTLRVLEQDKL